MSLAPHETRTVTFSPATTPALHLKNPRLWWPNGYGPQNLYRLHLSFSVGGAVSDAREVSFGIRKITYALPGSDNLALSVNGVPVSLVDPEPTDPDLALSFVAGFLERIPPVLTSELGASAPS